MLAPGFLFLAASGPATGCPFRLRARPSPTSGSSPWPCARAINLADRSANLIILDMLTAIGARYKRDGRLMNLHNDIGLLLPRAFFRRFEGLR